MRSDSLLLLLVLVVVATATKTQECFDYCMTVDGSESYCSFRCFHSNVPFAPVANDNPRTYDRCFSVCRAARTSNGARDPSYMDDCATHCRRSDARTYAAAIFNEYCETLPGLPVEGCINSLANLTQSTANDDTASFSGAVASANSFFSHVHVVEGVELQLGDDMIYGDILLPENSPGVLLSNVRLMQDDPVPEAAEQSFQYAQFRGYFGEEFVGTWTTHGAFKVENSLSIEQLYAANSDLYDENSTPLFVDNYEAVTEICMQLTGESYDKCVDVFDDRDTVEAITNDMFAECAKIGLTRKACSAAILAVDAQNAGANFFGKIFRAIGRAVRSVVRTVSRFIGGVWKAISGVFAPTKKVVNRTVAISVSTKTMEYEADEIVFPKAIDPTLVGKDMIKEGGKMTCSKPCAPSEFTEGVIIKVGKLLEGVTKVDERWLKGSMCVRCAQFTADARGQAHLERLKDISQNSEISLMSADGRYVRSSSRLTGAKNSGSNARFDVLVGPAEKLNIQGLNRESSSKQYFAKDTLLESGHDVELTAKNGGGHVAVAQNNMVWLDRDYSEARGRSHPTKNSQEFAGIPIADFTVIKIFGHTMDNKLTHGDTVAFMYQSKEGPRFLCQELDNPAHLIEGRAYCTQFKVLQSTIAVLEELGIYIYY